MLIEYLKTVFQLYFMSSEQQKFGKILRLLKINIIPLLFHDDTELENTENVLIPSHEPDT